MMPGMPQPVNKPKYTQMIVEVQPGKWEVIDKNGNPHKPTPGVMHHVGQMTVVKPYGGKMLTWGELKREGNIPASLQKLVAPDAHARAMSEMKAKPQVVTHRVLPPGHLPPGMEGGAPPAQPGMPPEGPPGMPGMPEMPQAQQALQKMPGAQIGAMS